MEREQVMRFDSEAAFKAYLRDIVREVVMEMVEEEEIALSDEPTPTVDDRIERVLDRLSPKCRAEFLRLWWEPVVGEKNDGT